MYKYSRTSLKALFVTLLSRMIWVLPSGVVVIVVPVVSIFVSWSVIVELKKELLWSCFADQIYVIDEFLLLFTWKFLLSTQTLQWKSLLHWFHYNIESGQESNIDASKLNTELCPSIKEINRQHWWIMVVIETNSWLINLPNFPLHCIRSSTTCSWVAWFIVN